jgi:hypothetical protein
VRPRRKSSPGLAEISSVADRQDALSFAHELMALDAGLSIAFDLDSDGKAQA